MIMKINLPKTKPRLSISRFLPIPILRLGIISLIFFPFLLLSSCGMISTLEDGIKLSAVLSKNHPGGAGVSFNIRSSNHLGVDLTNDVNYIRSLEITFADKSWDNLTEQKLQNIAENTVKLVNQEYPKLADADYIYVIFMYQDQNSNVNPIIYSSFTFQKTENCFQIKNTK
ncbi:MAG: hypothetical protein F6K18_21285 [Okeania sp. SIO2C2]|uniref:hypothetical protein n=1 Tax=Okeania sp. SIO2C2 TaxID=2607787 RepID=UPI0013BBD2BE|nr:hypothetical protein [Okeania sp. SIO2C2]NEP89156.1 hypothetical protein [Okeania sp. SIO2C2]